MSFPPPDPAHDAAVEPDPPARPTPPERTTPAPRPGDLTTPWRVMLGLSWLTAFFAYAGVWQASVQIGISTWWVGPRAQPTNVAVKLIPFYVTLVVALLVVYNIRWIVRWSAAGVAASALIAVPDFSRSVGLGIAESLIAGLLGVVTLASLTGRYRAASPSGPELAAPPRFDPAP
ncbi:MAG: hypothetical protein ABJH68_17070 [Ilumatobacter sp.]|uniref:hypothetical protein n=1 Tax=Ilumatobacter sp. TaxID=1967498 RepID=UPI0032986567